jgi:hypothetical protein
LGKLVFLGEDLWAQLLDLVGSALPSGAVEPEKPIPEVCEALEDDTAEPEEIAGRYYVPLDLPETLAEDLEVRDWPRAWDEERIWGDISPEEQRRLKILLRR